MNELACIGSPLPGHNPQIPECPICWEAFDPWQRSVTMTDCKHIFHVQCVSVWKSINPTCPICFLALSDRIVAVAPECAICLDDLFVPAKEVSVTSCHHRFHTDCLNLSCSVNSGCPYCEEPLSHGDVAPVKVDPLSPVSLEKCSLCIDVLDSRAALISTPCHHLFHRCCLAQFQTSECPLCQLTPEVEDAVFPNCLVPFDNRQSDGYKQVMEVMSEMVEKFCF